MTSAAPATSAAAPIASVKKAPSIISPCPLAAEALLAPPVAVAIAPLEDLPLLALAAPLEVAVADAAEEVEVPPKRAVLS